MPAGVSRASGLPAGGSAGQIPVKQSSTDGDVAWGIVESDPINSPVEYLGTFEPLIGGALCPDRAIVGDGIYPDSATRNATSVTYATRHDIYKDASKVRLSWMNITHDGDSEALVGTSSITLETCTVRASVRVNGTGTFHRLYTAAGADSVAIPVGQMGGLEAEFDVAAGDYLIVYTYVSTPTRGKWPASWGMGFNQTNGQGWVEGVDATADAVGIQSASPGRGGIPYPFAPSLIQGIDPRGRGQSVAVVGDSISSTADTTGSLTFSIRAFQATQVPYVRLAMSGDSFKNVVNGAWDMRASFVAGITSDVICALGANDIGEAVTLATLQSRAIFTWQKFRDGGAQRIYQTTITPRETFPGTATVRAQFNDWVRAGAPMLNGVATTDGADGAIYAGFGVHPLTDFIEIASLLETFENSGVYHADYYGDGVHPNNAAQSGPMMDAVAARYRDFDGAEIVTEVVVPQKHGLNKSYAPRFTSRTSGTTGLTATAGEGFAIEVDETFTIDALIFTILGAASGGTIRLGVYSNHTSGDARDRLAYTTSDIDATSVTVHTKTLNTPLELQAGYRYHLLAFLAGSPVSGPTVLRGTGECIEAPGYEWSWTTGQVAGIRYIVDTPWGAILDAPNPPLRVGSPATGITNVPLIGYRVQA